VLKPRARPETPSLEEDGVMGDRRGQYPRELRERAVRLVPEPREQYESEWAPMASIAARLTST